MNYTPQTNKYLKKYLDEKRKKIKLSLEHIFEKIDNSSLLTKAMQYSVMAGGKRLRPILSIATYELLSGKENDILDIACAIEMIHTYSLIHDDLPAMDNDILRRGKKTCHIKFDEATAILAGDALLTYAFEIISNSKKHSPYKILKIINIISKASGLSGMIDGQIRDISAERKKINLKELENLHLLKTGALIEASIVISAILASANKKQIDALKKYAKNIGLAFQITDDILDIEGDSKVMGKSVGSDIKLEKSTYSSLLGIKKSKVLSKELIDKAVKSLDIFDAKKALPLIEIAKYIINRKK